MKNTYFILLLVVGANSFGYSHFFSTPESTRYRFEATRGSSYVFAPVPKTEPAPGKDIRGTQKIKENETIEFKTPSGLTGKYTFSNDPNQTGGAHSNAWYQGGKVYGALPRQGELQVVESYFDKETFSIYEIANSPQTPEKKTLFIWDATDKKNFPVKVSFSFTGDVGLLRRDGNLIYLGTSKDGKTVDKTYKLKINTEKDGELVEVKDTK